MRRILPWRLLTQSSSVCHAQAKCMASPAGSQGLTQLSKQKHLMPTEVPKDHHNNPTGLTYMLHYRWDSSRSCSWRPDVTSWGVQKSSGHLLWQLSHTVTVPTKRECASHKSTLVNVNRVKGDIQITLNYCHLKFWSVRGTAILHHMMC